ncbi:5-formyltetrahydrofolate cyclo-ligase [Secundilactobacillus malefermentans]|uniref:5-formyltetrahydrofolate cyclo-ligase n=1 Tax=Secundilactobacillus malefermentans TaxID=176292 RepID=A0A4R5NT30_9LACO|nr:5-formyltetrahydrofolate cyclo-ligase [Secundilactobacillus malefermentans]QEA30698.1 5-formyltetrahydrofolate cyclo-ligase [Secundilactobacillus malefermentans]TDG80441.1 hypothetical protein C5L31_000807 [Secundilactobacillus malefermentans]
MTGKKSQRKLIIEKMQTISRSEKLELSNCLYDRLFNAEDWKNANSIAITLSTPMEIDTQPIIEKAWASGKTVLVPTTLSDWQMKFSPYTVQTVIQKNSHGIDEPKSGDAVDASQIDLIIVPGLGFSTSDGFRLGFGGGYYDRYLARYSGKTISLALPVQTFESPEWPTYEHDIPIQSIITCANREEDDK